jgi:beta-lactamase class A
MLTISDNDATDALLDRVGIEAVNISSVRLGLADTVITADLRTIINSIGHAAGFADWDAMQAWQPSRTRLMKSIGWCAA